MAVVCIKPGAGRGPTHVPPGSESTRLTSHTPPPLFPFPSPNLVGLKEGA